MPLAKIKARAQLSHFLHGKTPIAIIIFIVFCSLFTYFACIGLQTHTTLNEMDTTAYLGTAAQIRELGFIGLFKACFTGSYIEANRHPMYMLMISPVAAKTVTAFVNAKIVTAAIGLLLVVVFYVSVYRLYGAGAATVSTLLLTMNATFIRLTTMVACEAPLMLFLFLSWLCMVIGFRKKIFWIAAGAMAACAYLTKTSGLLLVPVFLFSIITWYRRQLFTIVKNKCFLGFFLAFFLVASPLLVRNSLIYHDPFYNINKRYFWMDSWQETYRPGYRENLPTFQKYMQKHPPKEIASIFLRGFFVRSPQLLSKSLKPFAFWQKDAEQQIITSAPLTLHDMWSVVIILFAIYGLWRVRKKEEFVVTLFLLGLMYLSVSWFSKVMLATRYISPVSVFIFIYAGFGVRSLFKNVTQLIRNKTMLLWLPRLAFVIFIAFSFWIGIFLLKKYPLKEFNIAQSYKMPKSFEAVVAWMHRNIDEQDNYFMGGLYLEQFFYFEQLQKGMPRKWPQFISIQELKRYIKENNMRYGMLDLETFLYRIALFKGHFGFNRVFGFMPLKEIKGFKIIAADPTPPRMFFIMEFHPEEF